MPKFWDMWESLSRIGLDPAGGTSRLAFSPSDANGRQRVQQWMTEAGLSAFVDGIGNVVGRRGKPPYLLVGSHTDTVPRGGNFDGIVGALAGIHLAQNWPVSARHGLLVVDWSCEESSRFGISTAGSRAAFGELSQDAWVTPDQDGTTLEVAAKRTYGLGEVPVWPAGDEEIAASLELHIEQGRELLEADVPIGVVHGIAAPQRWRVTLSGKPDHTGSAAMKSRTDALCAAAEVVLFVEHASRSLEEMGLRSTVARLAASPGVSNIVPHEADLLIDVRAQSETLRARYSAELTEKLSDITARRGVTAARSVVSDEEPSELAKDLIDTIQQAVDHWGLGNIRLTSWPSHDSLVISRHVPAGMIFVRNLSGVSHTPQEHCSHEDVDSGLRVLEAAAARFY